MLHFLSKKLELEVIHYQMKSPLEGASAIIHPSSVESWGKVVAEKITAVIKVGQNQTYKETCISPIINNINRKQILL